MRRSLLISGTLLFATAIVLSTARIEAAVGAAAGSLRWGPTLFRALLVVHAGLLVAFGLLAPGRANQRAQPNEPLSPASRAILLGILVVALALRIPGLDSCLWFDEVLTVVNLVRLPLGQIVSQFPDQNQHMLFTVLAHVSTRLFGESAWAVRLPSVAFAVASVWALFLLGRRLLGEREALLAAALMTVSYHHVWFAQNARGYMGLLFFATLATWCWVEARRQDRRSWYLWYAVLLALGMWVHLTMVFVPLAHALIAVTELGWRSARGNAAGALRRFAHLAGAWLLSATLTLQLYALTLPQFLTGEGFHEASLPSEWSNPLWVITESARSLSIGLGASIVVVAGLVVAAIGWIGIARRDPAVALALVLPPALGGLAMLALGHYLWPRFFFFAMGFVLLIVVHGTCETPRVILRLLLTSRSHDVLAMRAGVALTCFGILLSAVALPRVYALPKQDFVGARDYVEHTQTPTDAVVAVGLAGTAYRRYFAPHWLTADSADALRDVLDRHDRVWLVYTLPVELEAYRPDVWRMVQEDFEVVQVFPGTLGGGQVTVCRERNGRERG